VALYEDGGKGSRIERRSRLPNSAGNDCVAIKEVVVRLRTIDLAVVGAAGMVLVFPRKHMARQQGGRVVPLEHHVVTSL
jgi:hypothetical protein